MPAGFAVGTMIARRFEANVTSEPDARRLSTSFCALAVSAERNRSAGAPCSIFVSSADEESVDTVNVVPGCAVPYARVAAASSAFRDAAA
jgi:hypothetical protein